MADFGDYEMRDSEMRDSEMRDAEKMEPSGIQDAPFEPIQDETEWIQDAPLDRNIQDAPNRGAMREATSERFRAFKKPGGGTPFVVWLVLAMVVAFAIAGVGIGARTAQFVRTAERTNGEVVALVEVEDDGKTVYAPTIEFTDSDGETATFTSAHYSGSPRFDVGETVTVIYDPDNPQNVEIDSWVGLWVLPTIFTLIGGVLTVIMVKFVL